MKHLSGVLIVAMLILGACRAADQSGQQPQPRAAEAAVAPILTTPDAVDTHSYAKPLEARVSHVALDLAIDFNRKRIGGTARLDIQHKPDAQQIVLDDKGLDIHSIVDGAGRTLEWKVGAVDKDLGAPLSIALRPDTTKIVIKYDSAPDAGALLWLTPEQTVGKKAPFMFSQGE